MKTEESPSAPTADAAPSAEDLAFFEQVSKAGTDKLIERLTAACLQEAIGGRNFPLSEPDYNAKRPLDLSAYQAALDGFTNQRAAELDALVREKPAVEIEKLLAEGQLTSVELVIYYADRIRRYDVNKLNSVIELNPEALVDAAVLDNDRKAGNLRGPLHGLPLLLKDNIATASPLHTTAGAAVLEDWQPDRDAFVVQKLREAGVIILGKANLSEWANYMDPCMPSGFSALGGQTRNPYGPYDTLGSSSGSAVSVSANLTALSIGSETSGSIIQPGRVNGVVALRPSLGLVSRDYVIPLGPDLDTTGPMGRSLADVAALLTVMAGVDQNDPKTSEAAALARADFTQFLSLDQARKLRVGVIIPDKAISEKLDSVKPEVEKALGRPITEEEQREIIAETVYPEFGGDPQVAIDALKAQGIEVVEIKQSELPQTVGDTAQPQLYYGFQDGVKRFFAALGSPAPITSLAEVVAFNNEDLANRAPFGQGYVEGSASTKLTDEDQASILAVARWNAKTWMTTLLKQYDVDVIVTGMQYAGHAGAYGVPALTIPAGLDPNGRPQGVVISGDTLSEPYLFAVGYALEQALNGSVEPNLDAAIEAIEALK